MEKKNARTSDFVWIYALCAPETGQVRYIGKAFDPRARLVRHIYEAGMPGRRHLQNWVRSLLKRGVLPVMLRLERVPSDAWQEAERRWIAFHRAEEAELVNQTDGGDGALGCTHSPESVEQSAQKRAREYILISPSGEEIWTNRLSKFCEEHGLTRSSLLYVLSGRMEHHRGWRIRRPEGILPAIMSEEVRAKLSAAHRGRTFSEEHRARIAESNRRRVLSDETKAKMGAKNKGRRDSDETRAKKAEPFLVSYQGGPWERIVNLTRFCEERGLNRSMFHRVLRGQQETYKGWRIRRPEA